jgi:Ser-tRNA(Ala) deacylase AlaX
MSEIGKREFVSKLLQNVEVAVMAVEKLFWEDPYLIETVAKVTEISGGSITLDRTIIFAFSGGQQSDSGTIGGHEIIKADKVGQEIFYTIDAAHCLKVGDEVQLKIDWGKRYKLMKLHFAAELVLELVYRGYDHPEKIGANITEDKARVDFAWSGSIASIFPELEPKLQKLIDEDLSIRSEFKDKNTEERFWEIEGFAQISCGGTHLRRTGEIGPLLLKRNNIGKGKERIEIYLKPE